MKIDKNKLKWGIRVKYFDGTEKNYWYKTKYRRNKELKKLLPEVGPNKMIWSAWKIN